MAGGRTVAILFQGLMILAALVVQAPAATGTDDSPVVARVTEAKGPVGQPTQLLASLTIKDGYRFVEVPPRGNRVIELSSADEGVTFARRVFRGQIEGDAITFRLDVTPTKPGQHPVNGVFRVSYVTQTASEYRLMNVSLPLITSVTGTE